VEIGDQLHTDQDLRNIVARSRARGAGSARLFGLEPWNCVRSIGFFARCQCLVATLADTHRKNGVYAIMAEVGRDEMR
jgi:hypothetical protein